MMKETSVHIKIISIQYILVNSLHLFIIKRKIDSWRSRYVIRSCLEYSIKFMETLAEKAQEFGEADPSPYLDQTPLEA